MALEPVDYRTHIRDIEQTYLKVITNEDPSLKWLILSPNSAKEYHVANTGAEFHDFLTSFQDTSVEFGLCKTSPPGSDVEKIVLIGWCPDSAPLKSRSSFASNFNDISNNVLKSYHVQVTARDEDDLDENEILMRLSNAAGARYSIQDGSKRFGSSVTRSTPVKGSTPPVKSTPPPVKSTPPPVKSTPEPAPKPAQKFSPTPVAPTPVKASPAKISPPKASPKPVAHDDWDEPEVEERDLSNKPLKPNTSSWKPIGKIDLQKIIAEERAKEDPRLVTKSTSSSSKINPADDIAALKEKSKLKREQEYGAFFKKPETSSSFAEPPKKQKEGEEEEEEEEEEWEEIQKESPEAQEEDTQEEVNELKARFEKMNAGSSPVSNEPPIIQPRKYNSNSSPAGFKQPVDAPNPVLAGKNNYKKVGIPLPGMHFEEDKEEVKETPKPSKESDDGWSDEEPQETEDDNQRPVPSLPSRQVKEPIPETKLSAQKNITVEKTKDEDENNEPAPAIPIREKTPAFGSRQGSPALFSRPNSPALPARNDSPKEVPLRQKMFTKEKEQEEEDDDDEEKNDDEWDDDEKDEPPAPALPARNQTSAAKVEKEVAPEDEEEEAEEEEGPAPSLPPRHESPEPQLPPRRAAQPPPPPPKKSAKPQAIAEYDYDADEDNELTFKEGDKIINIEFVDDDWWLGELEDGSKGLFPSNYVKQL
ncbi:hypothetical protein ACO0QE_000842 [Hanseniaspora vineae]